MATGRRQFGFLSLVVLAAAIALSGCASFETPVDPTGSVDTTLPDTGTGADSCSQFLGRGYCTDYARLTLGSAPRGDAITWPVNLTACKARTAILFTYNHVGVVTSCGDSEIIYRDWNGGSSWTNEFCQVTDMFNTEAERAIDRHSSKIRGFWDPNPSSMSEPTPPGPATKLDPRITGISPAPTVSAQDRVYTLSGQNLETVRSLKIVWPGGWTTLSGPQLKSVASTGISVLITFGIAGHWDLQAITSDGRTSAWFGFAVSPASAPAPTNPTPTPPSSTTKPDPRITGISPAPIVGAQDRVYTISGQDLEMVTSLKIVWPGGWTTLSGPQLKSIASTGINALVTFGIAGHWDLQAITSDGRASAWFGFSVSPASAPAPTNPTPTPPTSATKPDPRITGISPRPTVSSRDEAYTLGGQGLDAVNAVKIVWPGGWTTLSGSQLRSVSANAVVLLITFGGPGEWAVQAASRDGRVSPWFDFTVVP